MCRCCMRKTHHHNPFHHIERWNGSFFLSAELWEVGSYVLVQHHTGEPLCESLRLQLEFLETAEGDKDAAEQQTLATHNTSEASAPTARPSQDHRPRFTDREGDWDMGQYDLPLADDMSDDNFMAYLDKMKENSDEQNSADLGEEEDELDNEELENTIPNSYLQGHAGGGPDHIFGTYLRVVHINGIHNIAMISCECRGCDLLPLDLLAARLLPSSFKRIRTLFTAQLLDRFRLCNLELKASAYQFYQLLRRLTRPMAPADVPDLYREFRRMSRLWRWMKKLKWAGYGSRGRNVSDVQAGELTIFCPACPQRGINIADDWENDPAR